MSERFYEQAAGLQQEVDRLLWVTTETIAALSTIVKTCRTAESARGVAMTALQRIAEHVSIPAGHPQEDKK